MNRGMQEMSIKMFDPIHPGEHLFEDFMKPLHISQTKLASDIGVPFRRIHEIVNGKRSITAETALFLGQYFEMSPEFWLRLQVDYDLEQEKERLVDRLKQVRIFKRQDKIS